MLTRCPWSDGFVKRGLWLKSLITLDLGSIFAQCSAYPGQRLGSVLEMPFVAFPPSFGSGRSLLPRAEMPAHHFLPFPAQPEL